MARGKVGMPKAIPVTFLKADLLKQLTQVDSNKECKKRVLLLETAFRRKIETHTLSLPLEDAFLRKFNTSPFVLLIHAFNRKYSHIEQIERDILPAKQFSSMETSAGRMAEEVALPIYGWKCVASSMHSANSALDGRLEKSNPYKLATLKSGPRCLNDEMSENFADAVIANASQWAKEGGVSKIDFTYGVLYGTQKISNKKDWHILRNLQDKLPKLPKCSVVVSPNDRWDCQCVIAGVEVHASIRIGKDWWTHLGGSTCLMEIMVALIRACVVPAQLPTTPAKYTIQDLSEIVSLATVSSDFNVGLLQRSQLPWLFLIASHFCDILS